MKICQAQSSRSLARENANIAASIGMDTLSGITVLLSSGALWQGLLLHYGISSADVGILTSAASIIQAVAMFCNIYFTDRFHHPIRAMALCNLPTIGFFVLMTGLCFMGQVAFSFPLLLAAVLIYNFFYGLRGIISYKIPFLIFRMERYGRITAVAGIFINVFSTLASVGIPVLLQQYDYDQSMLLLFGCGICLAIGTTVLNIVIRPLADAPVSEDQKANSPLLSLLLKEKSLRALTLSNFMRGISMGIVGSMALIAAYGYTQDSGKLSMLASVGAMASIVGNVLFTVFGKQNMVKNLCLLSSIGLCFFSIAMIFPKSWAVFLAAYLFLQICYALVNSTIPVMVAQFTPYQIIGGYSSLRMMITTAGSALSSMLTGFVLDRAAPGRLLSTVLLLLTAGITQLYTGIGYYRYVKSGKN